MWNKRNMYKRALTWRIELFCDAENAIFIDETEFEIALCCRKKTVVLKKQAEESRDG